jgi:hypothetical protein
MSGHEHAAESTPQPEAVEAISAPDPERAGALASAIGNRAFTQVVGGTAPPSGPQVARLVDVAILGGGIYYGGKALGLWGADPPVEAKKGVGDAAKGVADRTVLSEELGRLQRGQNTLGGQVMSGLDRTAAALRAPGANAAFLSEQIGALKAPIVSMNLPDSLQLHANGALMDQLRAAYSTVFGVDEPMPAQLEFVKTALAEATGRLQSVTSAAPAPGAAPAPAPAGGPAPPAQPPGPAPGGATPAQPASPGGTPAAAPATLTPDQVGAVEGALDQIASVSGLLQGSPTSTDLATAAGYLGDVATALVGVGLNAPEGLAATIDEARVRVQNAGTRLQAMGRSKEENLKLAADSLTSASGEARTLLDNIQKAIEGKSKLLEAAPAAPEAGGP